MKTGLPPEPKVGWTLAPRPGPGAKSMLRIASSGA